MLATKSSGEVDGFVVELPVAARLLEIGRADTIPAHGHATVGTAVPAPAGEHEARVRRRRQIDVAVVGELSLARVAAVDPGRRQL